MGPLEPNWCQVGEGMDEWMLFGEGFCEVNFLEASRNWEVEKLRNLHDLSLTYPLKNDRWKMVLSFRDGLFSGANC